jgi:hypothetical protein
MLPIYDMMASGKLSLLSSTAVEAPVKLGGESMYERFGFVPATRTIAEEDKISESLKESLKWIAVHCRTIAVAHMALADKVESLMEQFLDKRRFRTGLRTFARYHRRVAWQNLEMASRAEAAVKNGYDELDMADVVSA